jgi:quercetin dioxygenase-like cupin family protein
LYYGCKLINTKGDINMTINLITNLRPGVVAAGEGDSRHNVFGHSLIFKTATSELAGSALLWELISPPGTMVPPHVHEVEDEFIYVAEGELEVLVGDQKYTAGAGDLIKMPKGVPHGIWQKGDKNTRTLWTVVPAGQMEDLLKALGQLPANQPPDPTQVGKIFAEYNLELLPPPGL